MSGLGEPAKPSRPGAGQTEVWIGHRKLECVVCGGVSFGYREVLLNTSGMTYMGWDWLNKAAIGAICRDCGFVHEFLSDRLDWRAPGDAAKPWMAQDGE
jgi:hypothetical protein